MNASTAGKVAAVAAAMALLAPETASAQIVATTTDRNFLEVVVNKVSCQTEFDLAINVSGIGTHYRYKIGPSATTNPGVLTGYSSPIAKTTPASFNLTGQADVGYVLCLQGLELDRRGRIKKSQPLSQATKYYWTKDTAPVEYRVTFIEEVEGQIDGRPTVICGMTNSGTAVGHAAFNDGMGGSEDHAVYWTMLGGLEDISSLPAPWLDLETGEYVDGWIFKRAYDINEAGQIVGYASDGTSPIRGAIYHDGAGYALLPRVVDLPDRKYNAFSTNEYGEIQGSIHPAPGSSTYKTYLWSPDNPSVSFGVELATEPSASGEGIGTDTFMTRDHHSDALTLYAFSFVNGVLTYELLDTVPKSFQDWAKMRINDHGVFGYGVDNGTTKSVRLYLPGQNTIEVHESTATPFFPNGKINNSNDFVYNLDGIPYLYRYLENRSYRLYDLTDSFTKSTLFASSTGRLKDSTQGMQFPLVSDDNVASAPLDNPFDTMAGWVHYDLNTGACEGFVLTPMPKQ